MNVFMVNSPFQYVCANEARVFYKTKNNILVLKNKEDILGKEHLKSIFVEKDWDLVIKLPDSGRLFFIPKTIKILKDIGKDNEIESLFFSQYDCMITNAIKKNIVFNRHVYFDEGVRTLEEYCKYIENKNSYSRYRMLDDFIMRIQGVKRIGVNEHHDCFEMFSIFNIPDPTCKLIVNKLEFLRSKINASICYNQEGPVCFIGEGSVGCDNSLSEDEYFKILKSVSIENKKVLYFPHRSEKINIKERVMSFSNIEYQKTKYPIEFEIGLSRIELSRIYGIASSAVFTLGIIYKDIPITVIKTNEIDELITNDKHSYLRGYFGF